MNIRRTFRYPPYVFLALLTISHSKEATVIQTTREIGQILSNHLTKDTMILGPTPSPIAKIKNRYRYQCMIKYREEHGLHDLISKILDKYSEKIYRDELQIKEEKTHNQL